MDNQMKFDGIKWISEAAYRNSEVFLITRRHTVFISLTGKPTIPIE